MKKLTVVPGGRACLHTAAVKHLWRFVLEGSPADRVAVVELDRRLAPRPAKRRTRRGPRDPPDPT